MNAGEIPLTRQFSITRVTSGSVERVSDTVAAEEPLGIRISYWFKDARASESLALTMRTPGADRELVAGFLLTEGVIRNREDLQDLRFLGGERSDEVLAELGKDVDVEIWRLARNAFVNSSCGICGKQYREAMAQEIPHRQREELIFDAAYLRILPDRLRDSQQGFAQTGGLHAAALVGLDGRIETVFEDIGRHNALDKLIGSCLLNDVPLDRRALFLSSRSSYELVQKTAVAGAPILATVGGASSLAIEAARQCGITLIGFVRAGHFNIYSGEWRINYRENEASIPPK